MKFEIDVFGFALAGLLNKCDRSKNQILLKSVDSLDDEEIVPDFTFSIAELFQKLAF
jgi:hypothetical protein